MCGYIPISNFFWRIVFHSLSFSSNLHHQADHKVYAIYKLPMQCQQVLSKTILPKRLKPRNFSRQLKLKLQATNEMLTIPNLNNTRQKNQNNRLFNTQMAIAMEPGNSMLVFQQSISMVIKPRKSQNFQKP